MVSKEVIDWLLEVEDPSLRYRTLTEILDKSSRDREVLDSRKQILNSVAVKTIFGKMHPDGIWFQKNPRSGEILGDGVVYGAFGTTHFVLSYLAELGLDKNHPLVSKAALRYLDLQKSDGDFYGHFSCLLGFNIRTFVMLGFKEDLRVQKSIDSLLNTARDDGGYLCDIHEGKYKTKQAKSCIRGSVKALLAFSYLSELWNHPRVIKLVNYFLRRDGIFKTTNLSEFVNKDMQRNSFPITWRANVFEILLALSKMGYGKDKRLKRAGRVMDEKRDVQGRYILDWNPLQSPWKVGKRNQPNKWLTFYSILAHKFKDEN